MGNLAGEFEKKLNKLGIKKQVEASMVVEDAQKKITDLFGERGTQNLRVISYKDGVLKIAASNNLWAAECQGKITALLDQKIKRVVFTSTQSLSNQD